MRFSKIEEVLSEVTQKLIKPLKKPEIDGMILRKIYDLMPPNVEYSLTNTGKTIASILELICMWSVENFDDSIERIPINLKLMVFIKNSVHNSDTYDPIRH